MEIAGKNISEATAVRPKLPAPVKPATSADSLSIDKSEDSKKAPEKKKSHVARDVALGIISTAIALEGAGATATELTDRDSFLRNPEHTITEQIGHDLRYPLEWIENIQKNNENSKVLPFYDNQNKDPQLVQMGTNTIEVTEDQLPDLMKDSIQPVVKGQFPKVSTLFPLKLANQESIEASAFKAPRTNWITKEGEIMDIGKILRISAIGTELIVPVEGAEVFKFHNIPEKDGTLDFNGFVIKFRGPDQTPYEMTFYSNNIRDMISLPALDNAPFIGDKGGYGSYFAGTALMSDVKGLPIPEGISIAKTNYKNAEIHVVLVTLADKVSNLDIAPGRVVSSGFTFITLADVSGNQKIAILPASSNQP